MQNKSTQVQYTECEAAGLLGISVERFRDIVRNYINQGDEVPLDALYHASDLVVLRMLAGRALQSGEQWPS
jgi:hypothetical protein